jgi:AcrR family transcriptional regulator
MPKVNEEYFENKKNLIIDATYRVCLRKPVAMVTMSDVIEESGLSQGGIYRFYRNLDEILSDMITRMRGEYNFVDALEEVTGNKKLSFEEVTYRICDILRDIMEKHLMDIQKINFDLTVLAINDPERAAAVIAGAQGRGNFDYLGSVVMPALVKASKRNKLKPVDDPEKILRYISASYSGIEMNCILSACYSNGPMNVACKPKEMFDVLAKAIICLFGGKV